MINNPFEMDDFSLAEVQTINSEYEPDPNEIPWVPQAAGFKRLKKHKKKKPVFPHFN